MRLIRLLKHDLPSETTQWVSKGIISAEQAREILAFYGINEKTETALSFGQRVLYSIGALFIGLAVLLIVGRNWNQIPEYIRMISLIGLTVVTNTIALYNWNKDRHTIANFLFLFGSLSYGSSIFLIAQIYQLSGYIPEMLILWVCGVAPIGIITRNSTIVFLHNFLSFIWLMLMSADGHTPLLYLLLSGVTLFYVIYLRESKLNYLLSIIGIIYFLNVIVFQNTDMDKHQFTFQMLFNLLICLTLFTTAGIMQAVENSTVIQDYGLILRLWMLRFGVVAMFILSFSESFRQLSNLADAYPIEVQYLLFSYILLQGILLFFLQRLKGKLPNTEIFYSIAFLVFAILFHINTISTTPAVLFINALILVTGIIMIRHGQLHQLRSYVAGGTAVLMFLALIRYIDLIGDYMGAATLFIIEGILVIVIARHQRKSVSN